MLQLKAPKPWSALRPSKETNEITTTAVSWADRASATPWSER